MRGTYVDDITCTVAFFRDIQTYLEQQQHQNGGVDSQNNIEKQQPDNTLN